MNIHEYQAKSVLAEFGVPVPRGILALSVDEAVAAAQSLAGSVCVVKAQIHAGGRGKAGGVRVCKSADEVRAAASDILGCILVTKQTGPEGKQVNKLYIEEGLNIASEFYLSLLVDRESEKVAFVVSPDGGMDIEEVAEATPEKILTVAVQSDTVSAEESQSMAEFLGLEGEQLAKFADLASSLHQAFCEKDAAMLEINPLILTG